jgi:hypothetical protein
MERHHMWQILAERLGKAAFHFFGSLPVEGQKQQLAPRHTTVLLKEDRSRDERSRFPATRSRNDLNVTSSGGDGSRLLGVKPWLGRHAGGPTLHEVGLEFVVLAPSDQVCIRVISENLVGG